MSIENSNSEGLEELNQPKDKDLVWAWYDGYELARVSEFYDAKNKCLFSSSDGCRNGALLDNYEVIHKGQWPEWAHEAFEKLED